MYYAGVMKTVSDICRRLGRKEMERRLGVSKAAISNAVSNGQFPASWFPVIRDMCGERDLSPPSEEAFSFKSAASDAA